MRARVREHAIGAAAAACRFPLAVVNRACLVRVVGIDKPPLLAPSVCWIGMQHKFHRDQFRK